MNFDLQSSVARAAVAGQVFQAGVAAANPAHAVRNAINIANGNIEVAGQLISGPGASRKIFAVALGKAAFAMASGLDQALGKQLVGGVAVGLADTIRAGEIHRLTGWKFLFGGHPLPTQASFQAGRAVLNFVRGADAENVAIVFLISGGGSTILEWPIDQKVTGNDIVTLNSLLIGSGAPIREINIVRRHLSAIKGGRLAELAPRATKVGLIISDTNRGDEESVASGPTMPYSGSGPSPVDILRKYRILERLPEILRQRIEQNHDSRPARPGAAVHHTVVLQNSDALAGAAEEARRLGFATQIAADINEQEISAGCRAFVERFRNPEPSGAFCLLSGGEFGCRVNGNGRGGRNTESALRIALLQTEIGSQPPRPFTALCAGTDGIDGNSPAAGAISDETSLARAKTFGVDPREYLTRSDSFSFFDAMGDTIMTGPTGTNVRDIRVLFSAPKI